MCALGVRHMPAGAIVVEEIGGVGPDPRAGNGDRDDHLALQTLQSLESCLNCLICWACLEAQQSAFGGIPSVLERVLIRPRCAASRGSAVHPTG